MVLFIGMTPIIARSGNVLGYLRDLTPHKKAIFNRQGSLLGWWNPSLNKTFSSNGKAVSNSGDLRANLLSKSR